MNKLFLPVLFSTVLCAQNPAPPPADIAPDTVIATVDGRKLTYGELNSYVSTLAPAQAKTAMENLETTVRQYALLNKLSKMGEDDKLDQKQPYVDILRAGRMQVLAQATISEQYKAMLVLPNEQEGYYKDHLNQYSKLKVKTIYIGFAANPSAGVAGKKYRSEEEARTLAGDLVKKLRAGADFVAMVKEYSDDEASKKNDGDWGTVNASDNVPEDFKRAVLALKVGEVTEPMRRTGGFYIFKADAMIDRPYSEVRDDIYNMLKEVKMRKWMDKLQESIPVKVDPGALNPGKAAAPRTGQ